MTCTLQENVFYMMCIFISFKVEFSEILIHILHTNTVFLQCVIEICKKLLCNNSQRLLSNMSLGECTLKCEFIKNADAQTERISNIFFVHL